MNYVVIIRRRVIFFRSFFCFLAIFIAILKNIMYLKTKNYSMNEIIDKRTLLQNLEYNMSSFLR